MAEKAYYNRVMSDCLKKLIGKDGKFHWLIDFVKDIKHKELDFQNTEEQFSIYRGTSKILTLYQNGKIDVEEAYMEKFPTFYEKPTKENFEDLICDIDKCQKFNQYVNEGWYQSLIGRRYSFENKEQDEFIIFDKELMIHNSNKDGRREKLISWRDDITTKIEKELQEDFSKPKGTPRKLDLVGISENGDLWLIEVKQDTNTCGIYNSPIQIGMYYKRIYWLMDTNEKRKELGTIISKMLDQKQKLGLINEAWKIPTELSGKIKLAVVVGGKNVNPVAIRRLNLIKSVVEEDPNIKIAYYSCKDDGELEEIKDFDAKYLNSYSDKELVKQVKLLCADKRKNKSEKLFCDAEGGGVYGIKKKMKRSFVLRETEQDKNLYCDIRKDVLKYFTDNPISWHTAGHPKGYKGPSGHILSSQIACLNHLFAIREDEEAVRAMINGIYDIKFESVEKITYDKCHKGYIAFEVIDENNNLNERGHRRGSYCTSIDALVCAMRNQKKWLIMIEWKYTETYGNKDYSTDDGKGPKGENKTGKARMKLYNHLIKDSDYLERPKDDKYQGSIYYQEPFYQLMRQTLWAEQMIANKSEEKIKADYYLHLHVIPKGNKELLNKGFHDRGKDMKSAWTSMLTDKGKKRYKTIDPEELLAPIADEKKFPKYKGLIDYLRTRYWDRPSETTNDNQKPSTK